MDALHAQKEDQVPVLELFENICKKRKRTTSCKEHTQDTDGKFIITTLKTRGPEGREALT